MKKLVTICLFIAINFSGFSQTLKSGDYTITISEIKLEKNSIQLKYDGNYSILKKGAKLASYTFSTLQMSENNMLHHISKTEEGYGSSVFYSFDSKKYEWQGKEKKVKHYNKIEDLILQGILFYSELKFKDK